MGLSPVTHLRLDTTSGGHQVPELNVGIILNMNVHGAFRCDSGKREHLLSASEKIIHLIHGITLHLWQYMSINIQRGTDRTMP